jgi:phage baseplate assembly protein gpV
MTLSLIERLLPPGGDLNALARELAGWFHVASPAIVQSFNVNGGAPTVTVKCALLETIQFSGVQGNVDPGIIADVPVAFYRGGGCSVTLPIAVGDECLLVFADGCIDAWFQSGGQQSRIDGRRHSLSDAIAVFGLTSTPRALTNYSTIAMQLRSDDGTTVIEVGASEITIKANTITVQGQQVNVTGSTNVAISGNNTTTIDGVNFLEHTHTGVTAGGGVTGPVVP